MTPRRIASTILILALVIVGGISVPYVIEAVRVRSLRRAWAERVAALEARGVPLTLYALEASLPPPPPEAQDGAPLLREAVRRYEERWPAQGAWLLRWAARLRDGRWPATGAAGARPPHEVLFDWRRTDEDDASEERAGLWAQLQAAVPDLEPLWALIDEAAAQPFLHVAVSEHGALMLVESQLLDLRRLLRPGDRSRCLRSEFQLALHLAVRQRGSWFVFYTTHGVAREFRAILVENQFTGEDDLDAWAAQLDALEASLLSCLEIAVAEGRIGTLDLGRSPPDVVLKSLYSHRIGSPGLAEVLRERSAYDGPLVEGHALAGLCGELDAWNRVEAGFGDEARLRAGYPRTSADAVPRTAADRNLYSLFFSLSNVRLMRVGLALESDRRSGRAPARGIEELAGRHGFAVPVSAQTGAPLEVDLFADFVRIGFEHQSRTLGTTFWEIPRWDREPQGEAGKRPPP